MKYTITILFSVIRMLYALQCEAQTPNERFEFELRFGIFKGGEAHFILTDTIIDNEKSLYAMLHSHTTGFTDILYSVNDKFESIIDRHKLIPLQSTKNLTEQNYKFENKVTFNQDSKTAISQKSGIHYVDENICDVSSLMCYVRHSDLLQNIHKNQIIEIPFWDTDEWYYLKFKFTGNEKIKTKLGTFECIRLEPMEVAGRFFNKKNPMNIWLTNDSRKLPVLMELNFTIGSVKCELINT